MDTLKLIVQIIASVAGCLAAVMSILLFVRLRWPAAGLFILKSFASALSPVLLLVGIICTITGLITGSLFTSLVGIYDILIFSLHIFRITRPPDPSCDFEKAFGQHWEKQIHPEQKDRFLPKRMILMLPAVPDARWEQNIPFSTIPESGRNLLCDIWQPPTNVMPSGLAFIYLHGSAWYLLDKDTGTRPFFRRLAAQGHVIMDVAYGLAPETGLTGMVNDVKRAIVWMKDNSGKYKVNPARIVLGGGSAGAHLALLTAYTASDPRFIPKELEGKDVSVRAVISEYGPTDLEAYYYHTNQHLTTRSTPGQPKKAVPTKMPGWIIKKMGKDYHRLSMDKDFKEAGALATLLGGHPDECPEHYALFSPVTHVHADCSPTLLIQGEHDIITPIKSTRFLYSRLKENKIPAVMHVLPQTDHAFDLILPNISPSAHNAFYDVERFLAMMI